MRRFTVLPIALAIGSAPMLGPGSGQAQTLQPKLPDLSGIVKDQEWALVLGKALFWDVSVGSDGMACASCHFHAGADARISNALSPGLLELPELDPSFGATEAMAPFKRGETASGGIVDSTYQLVEDDFPFHQLEEITDRNSSLLVTTNDVASSAGAVGATLTRIRPVGPFDECDAPLSDIFHAGGLPARQVEPRHTPTVINFSLFWGIAVMLYEATLISDDSPFDRAELSVAAERGRVLFTTAAANGGGNCSGCHTLPLGTQAAQLAGSPPFVTLQTVNRPNGLLDGGGNPITTDALRDRGFFPLGVRPVAEDVGLGGTDPYGEPLSFARRSILDGSNPGEVTRTIVDASFKVPGLRNVALTPPYFHNGGFADLHQVLEFYRRAGNRRDAGLTEPGATGDDSGTGLEGEGLIPVPGADKGSNAAGTLNLLTIDDQGADDIIEFLKAMTDQRVQCDEAPFDHPELRIPLGHEASDANGDRRADDIYFRLPAVGAAGYDPASGLCIPNAGDLFAEGMQARIGGPPAPPLE